MKSQAQLANTRRVGQRGFTLIEVLVVLVIIGFFSGMVVLSIGDTFERTLRSEAERFQSLIVAAADEAVYTSSELGVLVEKNSYVLVRFDPIAQGWMPFAEKGFQPHLLPTSMLLSWEIEGFRRQNPDIDDQGDYQDSSKFGFGDDEGDLDADRLNNSDAQRDNQILSVTPQILLLSSGELTAFTVDFGPAENVRNAHMVQVISDGFSLPSIKSISAKTDD